MSEEGPVPLSYDGKHWHLIYDPRSVILTGRVFNRQAGYCVVLMFQGGEAMNELLPNDARKVVRALREGDDEIGLADSIEHVADVCDFMNATWVAIGKPADGVDESVGRA